jgi:hypothetical protein
MSTADDVSYGENPARATKVFRRIDGRQDVELAQPAGFLPSGETGL